MLGDFTEEHSIQIIHIPNNIFYIRNICIVPLKGTSYYIM